jgi:hypothetical protein
MKIYDIKATGNYGKPWAWASGLMWYEGKMDYWTPGPTLDSFRKYCSVEDEMLPGINIDNVGRLWPDWLGAGGGVPSYYVSQRVIDSLRRAGISYRRAIEMPIGHIASKKLRQIPPPVYYVLEAPAAMTINLVKRKVPGIDCFGRPIGRMIEESHYVAKADDWPGTELVSIKRLPPKEQDYIFLFATQRIVDLAAEDGWTNFEAKEIEVV